MKQKQDEIFLKELIETIFRRHTRIFDFLFKLASVGSGDSETEGLALADPPTKRKRLCLDNNP